MQGYSLAFSDNASPFIGTLHYAFFRNMFTSSIDDNNTVPELANAIFEGMFCYVTSALLIGSLADRGRVLPALVFLFAWCTLVYDPIACWTWNPNGWASKMGYLDYAGGTPVHLASGVSALALSFMLGKRIESRDELAASRPFSTIFVVIGTFFMWAGWFGFNTGTSLTPTPRSSQALLNTQISASFGGIAWVLLDYRLAHKWSIVGFCSGIVAGLVAITPGAGYVPTWAAVITGVVGGLVANVGTKVKFYLGIDDSLDVFAVHGLGAIVGNLLTGLFASTTVTGLDGVSTINGGWIEQHYIQLAYQLAGTAAAAAYAFVVTILILFVIMHIPGLHLRVSPDEEEAGLDFVEHDEYAFDYIEMFPSLPELWGSTAEEEHVGVVGDEEDDTHAYALAHKAAAEEDSNSVPPSPLNKTNGRLLSKLLLRKDRKQPRDIEMAERGGADPAGSTSERSASLRRGDNNTGTAKSVDFTPMPNSLRAASSEAHTPRGGADHHQYHFQQFSMFPLHHLHHQTQGGGNSASSSSGGGAAGGRHTSPSSLADVTSRPNTAAAGPAPASAGGKDHEAIEGASTYHRIQEHLELSRWRGRFRGNSGTGLPLDGHVDDVNQTSAASNLSPTATHEGPQREDLEYMMAGTGASNRPPPPPSEVSTQNLDAESFASRPNHHASNGPRPLIAGGSVHSE